MMMWAVLASDGAMLPFPAAVFSLRAGRYGTLNQARHFLQKDTQPECRLFQSQDLAGQSFPVASADAVDYGPPYLSKSTRVPLARLSEFNYPFVLRLFRVAKGSCIVEIDHSNTLPE
ncbi:hypothetical protein [Rhizobium sp. BK251]|uniref:hypothetical protein n=1 Tax=Rhizobium sp. BK251 TaxID=2512125 RepID=UPI001FDFAB1F|nr:hypothetical protein [Rhizobium sp. BK251]